MLKLIIGSLLLFCTYCSNATNILAVFNLASPSHHIWNSPLVVALANKGHNVTVISAIPQKTKIPNLTDIVIPNMIEDTQEDVDFFEMGQMSLFEVQDIMFQFGAEICIKTMDSDAWAQILQYPSHTKFDLLIIESIASECLLGSLHKFGIPPIVVVNAFNVPVWLLQMTGSPNVVSHMPHTNTESDSMSFPERIMNFVYASYAYFKYNYVYLPKMDKVAKEHFGSHIPSVQEAFKKISLGMANFNPVLDYSWARTPNLIPVAGVHLRNPKPLLKDLQNFLDGARDGAIIFSLGTNVKSDKLPQDKKQAILEAFAELPQKILWKFEAKTLPGLPKNVKLVQWLPQNDVLAHPNIKLFITHSGLLSTHEAIYHAVPMVGIPIFGDQPMNIQKIVNLGAGIRLNYLDLNKNTLLEAIKTVLEDSSYRENMKALSNIFRDDPETPLERAVFWTEYVLRHKGAPHLRSAALELNMMQYLLMDVVAFLLAIPMLLFSMFYCLCCRRKSNSYKKLKNN